MYVFYFENKQYPTVVKVPWINGIQMFMHPRGVVYESGGYFFVTGLNKGGDLLAVKVDGISLPDWITKTFGDAAPVKLESEPGVYYKRIKRPVTWGGLSYNPYQDERLAESFVALRILLRKLEELFQTVEPVAANMSVYGHRIREIILLACMEVESSWAAVLKENGYSIKGSFSTNDYVKLFKPMLLDSYQLFLQSYSAYPPFSPFAGWDAQKPTESLNWYDAYNKTKHDREENLKFGTLDNAIRSVGAAVVMFYAQFGFRFGVGIFDQKTPVINNVFRLVTTGFEAHEKEFYIPLYSVKDGAAAAESWRVTNYTF
jgi:hypothetical protein